MESQYQMLLGEVRQEYANVVWTHKIQEQQAELYEILYKRIELFNILASALTACGILSTIYQDRLWIKIVSALLSFVTLFITAYLKSFNLKSMARENKEAANKFLVIRNKLLTIITDIHIMESSLKEIQEEYEKVDIELNKILITAPATTTKAVERARIKLNVEEDYTYKDEEIDRFLPTTLRGRLNSDSQKCVAQRKD